MISQIINIFSIILIVFILIVYIRSSKKKKSIKKTLVMIISTMLLIFISSSGIENLFIKYNSPEMAFKNSGCEGYIKKTIDTEHSTLLIYGNDYTNSCILLNKVKSKWQISIIHENYYMKTLNNGTILTIYKEKGYNNYYIMLTPCLKEITVYDSKNSIFEQYNTSRFDSSNMFSNYVTFVNNLDNKYYLIIGDEKYYVLKEFNLG